MAGDLACDKFWVNKNLYHDAEKKYYENLAKLQRKGEKSVEVIEEGIYKNSNDKKLCPHFVMMNGSLHSHNENDESFSLENKPKRKKSHFENIERRDTHDCLMNGSEKKGRQKEVKEKKNISDKCKSIKEDDLLGGVGMARLNQDTFPKTSLAGEVAKARQHIKSSLECMNQSINGAGGMSNARLTALLEKMEKCMEDLTKRVEALELKCASCPPQAAAPATKIQTPQAKSAPSKPAKADDDDDVDLFGSDSEEEDEEAKKIREQRLAEYAAKKSKKPALVAKSNIILDIKPWDDETDMKEMEKAVRAIEMDGLVWGASKLMPVAFKIFKLQISCVIEDDKVSVDLLTETLEDIQEYIQSVDIAAFNKV